MRLDVAGGRRPNPLYTYTTYTTTMLCGCSLGGVREPNWGFECSDANERAVCLLWPALAVESGVSGVGDCAVRCNRHLLPFNAETFCLFLQVPSPPPSTTSGRQRMLRTARHARARELLTSPSSSTRSETVGFPFHIIAEEWSSSELIDPGVRVRVCPGVKP